ncbi:methionine--tRNA ligase, mitochondrial-like [Artemia franciscana]|uniref:methionine--tRNA ligase, mitochondrial-like n=1 Tax=Artemia franciscana TaxID=6661 RepID=UPI0032DB7E4A
MFKKLVLIGGAAIYTGTVLWGVTKYRKAKTTLKGENNVLYIKNSKPRPVSEEFCHLLPTLYSEQECCIITTPIFYANGDPHIGHAYTSIMADVMARCQSLDDKTVLYVTGMDEHGLKIKQAATKNKRTVQAQCDYVSQQFCDIVKTSECSPTTFIRTTEERHCNVVQAIWTRLAKDGFIKKKIYSGYYSVSDEDVVNKRKTIVINGKRVTKDSRQPVETFQEENYVFSLLGVKNGESLKDLVIKWLKLKSPIKPEVLENQSSLSYCEQILRELQKNDLDEWSISRLRSNNGWGIQVPGDSTQTIHVWFDALCSYLTATGYLNEPHVWPPDIQVIGKDILKFHSILWPAILLALGLDLPKQIFVHGHWLVEDVNQNNPNKRKKWIKMSKSTGTAVTLQRSNTANDGHFLKMKGIAGVPDELSVTVCSSTLRYFLLRSREKNDNHFQYERLVDLHNTELVNKLCNLLSRCTSEKINPTEEFPKFSRKKLTEVGYLQKHLKELGVLKSVVAKKFAEFQYSKGIDAILCAITSADSIITSKKPWTLEATQREKIVSICLETCRIAAILLQPIIPNISSQILDILGIKEKKRKWRNAILQEEAPRRVLKKNKKPLLKRMKIQKGKEKGWFSSLISLFLKPFQWLKKSEKMT